MALGHMDGASTALKTARAAEALASQLVALSELETALDEVRAAIRRLEEGNVERVRSLLRELLQGALQTQIAVRRDTARLESERGRGEMADRPHRLAAAGLSRRQGTVARSAHQGIALLAEVGGSPALSVALSGVAEDAAACALMLADGSTGPPVPGIQQDVELLLARLLEALKGELAPPQELPPVESEEAEPDERQRLLALHSELRVLADLQSGLRSRTARVQKARDAGELADEWAAGEVGRIARSQLGITGALRRIDLALRAAGGR
jgi:hypothetical protein